MSVYWSAVPIFLDSALLGAVANDTVTGDPLFTVPLLGGGELCYDIRGKPGIVLNLVSDKCTSVNADYVAMDVAENGNFIRSIGVRAVGADGNCHNIEMRLAPSGGENPIIVLINSVETSGVIQMDGIRIRTYSDRVRISVPNCELISLIMWAAKEEVNGQSMLRFQISRGYNLAPTSHGLIGRDTIIDTYSSYTHNSHRHILLIDTYSLVCMCTHYIVVSCQ